MGKVEQRKIKKQQEKAKREEKKELATITAIKEEYGFSALSESFKIKGLDKLGQLSLKQSFELLKRMTPTILRLTGVFKDGCPPNLIPIIDSRNNVVDTINNTIQVIQGTIDSVNGVGETVRLFKNSLSGLTTAQVVNSTVAKVIPSPPGTPGILAAIGDDLNSFIPNFETGIEKDEEKFEYNSTFLNYTSNILNQTKKYVTSLDFLILGCDPNANLTPTNNLINELENEDDSSSYKGFTFQIQEVPFNDSLNRNKAIALNKSNIPVIETELSFTLEPNVLIDQLKLRIDQENLKAD
ncbi:hypothetical protein [Haliea sp.]|uniref:hypothetical protein n=1 Tax=Haliea sp. TaxID=1932666 RepID=UPI00257C7959|nr:hypothetical protein [Haliea sp.]